MLTPENGWESEFYQSSQDVVIYDINNHGISAKRTIQFPAGAKNIYLSGSAFFSLQGSEVYFRPTSEGEFSCIIAFELPSPVQVNATNKRTGFKYTGRFMQESEGIISCWLKQSNIYQVQMRITGRCVKPVLSINYLLDEKFDFGVVHVNDFETRQAYLYNTGTGDLNLSIEKQGNGENIEGTQESSEIWIQESNYEITQIEEFNIANTRYLLSLQYSPKAKEEAFYYNLVISGMSNLETIIVTGSATRPLASYGWYKEGDWEGIPGSEFKYILRDLTNAIHERERVLGYGELDDEEPAPIRIATVNGSPKRGDTVVRERNVILTGSCSPDLESIYVNGLNKGVKYLHGETTWSWSGILNEGKNRIVVTGYVRLSAFCFPDEMIITVDSASPVVTEVSSFNLSSGNTRLILRFNEDVDEESILSENFEISADEMLPANTLISGLAFDQIQILSAEKLEPNYVQLYTSRLAEDVRYNLTTNGVLDLVGNATDSAEKKFIGAKGKPLGVELSTQFKTGVYQTGVTSVIINGICNKLLSTRFVLVFAAETKSWTVIQILPGQSLFSYSISLSDTINLIFYEVDMAGAVSSPFYLRLIYTGGVPETQYLPPTITYPVQQSTYSNQQTVIISGTAQSGVVAVNEGKVQVINGSWSYEYKLKEGYNSIGVVAEYLDNGVVHRSESIFVYVEYDIKVPGAVIYPLEYIESGGGTFDSISRYIGKNGIAKFVVKFDKQIKLTSFNPTNDLIIVGATFVEASVVAYTFNSISIADTWVISIRVPENDAGRVSIQVRDNTAESINGIKILRSNEYAFFYDRSVPRLHSVRIHGVVVTAGSPIEIDSTGPINVEIIFTKQLRNFDYRSISITSNANIMNFRAQRFVETDMDLEKYTFSISPRVLGAKIYMDIVPLLSVTDFAGNIVDMENKTGPYIINYAHPEVDNPWQKANELTSGRIREEEPFTYWLKPEVWIKPCDPYMVSVYWMRPTLAGKGARIKGIMSNPTEDYFVGIPLTAMFTERDVYFVTKECEDQEADINSTIQEIARVYDLAGGTMTAQMSEFNDECRYRLHKQEWRVPYMPMGDLINSMRLAIERLVNIGHRRGPTHYIARFCHWVDQVPYRKILDPLTMTWEIEYVDYGFWKVWTMEELLSDVNTKADWLTDADVEKSRPMWVDYTKGHTLNKKIWFQLRDVLNRLTCVKWDISACGMPGNCAQPTGRKGSVKKFGYNVCSEGWSSLQLALGGDIGGASYYQRGGYYPVYDYGYSIKNSLTGIEYGFVAQVREVVPNESLAYPDIGWGSGARSITVDTNTIPAWSTAYIKGDWVDTWIVALLSAEGVSVNSKYLGYAESYVGARLDNRTEDYLYGGCIMPGSGAGFAISDEASGASWSVGGSGASAGGETVFDMGWFSSPSRVDPGVMESNACVRSNYTLHQTFDWGGICYSRGGSGILTYGEDYKDTPVGATPSKFKIDSDVFNLTPTVEEEEFFGRIIRREKYPYPFTWQQDKVGGGSARTSGWISFQPKPSKRIRGHVKFSLMASPQAYGNNLNVPGGVANSFVVTNCLNVIHHRDTTEMDNDFCNCKPGLKPARGENGFALYNCDRNVHVAQNPGIYGAKYPDTWDNFQSGISGIFFSL